MKILRFDTKMAANKQIIEPIRCHCAILDNKYYSTQIYLIELDEPLAFPDRFYEFIHGIIIYFDHNDEDCLKNLSRWINYIDLMENCSIKILSCDFLPDTNIGTRYEIQNYCINKGFELIELTPLNKSIYEDDEDFKESYSYERLYKSIQAYVWPNLNYKGKFLFK